MKKAQLAMVKLAPVQRGLAVSSSRMDERRAVRTSGRRVGNLEEHDTVRGILGVLEALERRTGGQSELDDAAANGTRPRRTSSS